MSDLVIHLRDRLAPYKLPRTFERSDEPLRILVAPASVWIGRPRG